MSKIVHMCVNGLVTDGWNYQENVMTKYQKLDGNDVTVITTKWMWGTDGNMVISDKTDYINDDGVHMIRLALKGKENYKNKFKMTVGLYETLSACAPEILFIHGVSYRDIGVAVKYLKHHPDVIAYADNHGDLTNSGTNWISKNILHGIVWKRYAQSLVPYVKKFYGVLPIRVDFLTDIYKIPKEKCELLVMGADDEHVESAAAPTIKNGIRKKYGIAEDDFLIMTGGKIDAFKTQTLLLMEAVQNIRNDRVRLIVFGSIADEIRDKVNSLADGKKVQYIGWVQSQDSYQYFASADLVVFPGRHSVFWEQVAAQGIPMLCKDLPGTHHVDLGGNVHFLSKDSVEEIQNEIQRLIDNPDQYEKMKSVAIEKGMKEFSYREISRRAIGV